MRRKALGIKRNDFDEEGTSFMTVYRMETGKVRACEKTYRKVTRAMGEEESTRRGILKTKDVKALQLINSIADMLLHKDYENAQLLISELENNLDSRSIRNKKYISYVKMNMQYMMKKVSAEEYEIFLRDLLKYGTEDFNTLDAKRWPFHEREWNMVVSLIDVIRKQRKYELQKALLELIEETLQTGYLEGEYRLGYLTLVNFKLGDALGNMGFHRLAINIDEKALGLCKEKREFRHLAEIYYDIFWNYWMIKKKETLTAQEEFRCRECLIRAYYINQACYPIKELYRKRLKECYPDEIVD